MKFGNSKFNFKKLKWRCSLTDEGIAKGFVHWKILAPDWSETNEREFAIIQKSPSETEFRLYIATNCHQGYYNTIEEATSVMEKEYKIHMRKVCFE